MDQTVPSRRGKRENAWSRKLKKHKKKKGSSEEENRKKKSSHLGLTIMTSGGGFLRKATAAEIGCTIKVLSKDGFILEGGREKKNMRYRDSGPHFGSDS